MDRRSFLQRSGAAWLGLTGASLLPGRFATAQGMAALKRAAQEKGKLIGTFTVRHQLVFEPMAAETIANIFSLLADGNDLKFSDRLRPTPDQFNFSAGDPVVQWAEQHGLLFRGHCLVWWNALPHWFSSYVTPANAQAVMTHHIDTVLRHYAGRVYSWDVVNEPLYHDGRPDGLRVKPWLALLGPEYIDLAFHIARGADPHASLVLNECYIEHATPGEDMRRGQLLALATRLRKANVPITHIGIQGHLRGATPLNREGLINFSKQIQDLGLQIMITEFDVDDVGVPPQLVNQTVAAKYGEFVDIMGPYVTSITFEALNNNPAYPSNPDGTLLRPNLFDANFQPDQNYTAVVAALNQLPSTTARAKQLPSRRKR